MKKVLFLLLLLPSLLSAQQGILESKKNEVRFDAVSMLAFGKFGLSYEYFLGKDFSVGITANFLNSKKTTDDFDGGFRNNLPKYEFNPYVRYALSKSKKRYYFAEVFGSSNGGDYKETVRLVDSNNIGYYAIQKSKYTDFGLGGSLGYKMYFKDAIALEFLVGFGKNLTNTAKSPDVITRVGINLGYRF
ncbi:DUF3575 domain-containing protein [Flavobacterium sp. SUN046]|uniref:DUF3575 domain-containing protein n=1 Tax=Flavobacterium sp. SUN046 TaxID=3002440 RepID=UPI002DBECA37|nr:DUF3575 domain-containing protein [Flavobacterium sp. SUN046]MEC4048710.1 DUF3575 domain-containing protein [Flavobacterium sp. SUN046]